MALATTFLSQAATAVGLVAASIAVGGFLAHAGPTLAGWDQESLRKATVAGGLWGVAGAAAVIVLSALIG